MWWEKFWVIPASRAKRALFRCRSCFRVMDMGDVRERGSCKCGYRELCDANEITRSELMELRFKWWWRKRKGIHVKNEPELDI